MSRVICNIILDDGCKNLYDTDVSWANDVRNVKNDGQQILQYHITIAALVKTIMWEILSKFWGKDRGFLYNITCHVA